MIERLRWLAIAALLVGYPFLAHHTAARSPAASELGALVALAPVVLVAFLFAWHSPRRTVLLAALALACALVAAAWPLFARHFALVYWLDNVGFETVLLMSFGRTLLAGRQPLCTRFAEALYGPVSVAHAVYTRQVTIAWTIFFAAMLTVSTLLFFLAPLSSWSIFANFLTLPLVALMFIGEFAVRRRVLPDMQHMRILDAVRAFRNDAARSR